jgi:hypothetical protein
MSTAPFACLSQSRWPVPAGHSSRSFEEPAAPPHDAAILSERSLAEDWNRPEEDAAWSHLQSDR